MSKEVPTLMYVVTEDHYFCSHRLPVAKYAKSQGYRVIVVTNVNKCEDVILSEGFELVALKCLERASLNPLKEASAIMELMKVYKQYQPDIVHHVAMKPIIYGSIAAYVARTPSVINALTGLGFIYTAQSLKARLIRPWIKQALKHLGNRQNTQTIFQNETDQEQVINDGLLLSRSTLIPGSGIDLNQYPLQTISTAPSPLVITMVSRMLKDKGVYELIAAAKQLKEEGVNVKIRLVGAPDPGNPNSVSEQELLQWHDAGYIEYLGYQSDVVKMWRSTHVAILPSYREGISKALLEAAACGRAIIATDVPGCREIVADGENGILIPPKNPEAIVNAIKTLAAHPDSCERMGVAGRAYVAEKFSVQLISQKTQALYDDMLKRVA